MKKRVAPKQERAQTIAEQLATWTIDRSWSTFSSGALRALKLHVLDTIGCAIGALHGGPVRIVRKQNETFGGKPLCTMIGGGKTAPDRAALYNGALVRYLDFMDNYMGEHQTCHPCDNFAGILAASEVANAPGKDFLTSLAIAYQVQSRLCDVAPIQEKGFDHTTQLSYSLAAGAAHALHLPKERAAHAIAIAGASFNPLWVTRTGYLSNWKGIASAAVAHGVVMRTMLAQRGMTGPLEVFEGHKGFMESIAGNFEIDWSRETFERVSRSSVKKFNAEVHTQSLIEAVLELRDEHQIDGRKVDSVDIDIFKQAYRIVGGSREGGDKKIVDSKEQADHSIPYVVAVALLDGELMPKQYLPARIQKRDVQNLLRRVSDRPKGAFTRAYPSEMQCRVRIVMRNGDRFSTTKNDYEGFFARPMSWGSAAEKFNALARPFASDALRDEIVDAVRQLERIRVGELTRLLQRVGSRS